jgi:hypothetical protein
MDYEKLDDNNEHNIENEEPKKKATFAGLSGLRLYFDIGALLKFIVIFGIIVFIYVVFTDGY